MQISRKIPKRTNICVMRNLRIGMQLLNLNIEWFRHDLSLSLVAPGTGLPTIYLDTVREVEICVDVMIRRPAPGIGLSTVGSRQGKEGTW